MIEGIIAAGLSPLAMTVGFTVWGKCWKGSAFSLNIFKCTLAGALFMIICLASSDSKLFSAVVSRSSMKNQSKIIFSSFLGIVIGDNAWLLSLQIIGAKQVIVIDTLKPFLAAILGFYFLGEPFSFSFMLGIIVSTFGIILVSLESFRKRSEEEQSQSKTINRMTYTLGYVLAIINVLFDAFGSLLTKKFGKSYNTFEINFLRFGFASVILVMTSWIISIVIAITEYKSNQKNAMHTSGNPMHHSLYAQIEMNDVNQNYNQHKSEVVRTFVKSPWYLLPFVDEMTTKEWLSVIGGIMVVTFLCPALSNYALFEIPLGLCLTLTSLGPVYSVPVVYFISSESTGWVGLCGATLTFVGVFILCLNS